MSKVFAVLAIGVNNEFGNNNREDHGLPFNSKADMRWFFKLTKKRTVLVSEATLSFISSGLSGREILINTRQGVIKPDNSLVDLGSYPADIYICGGSQVYKTHSDKTDLVFVSIVSKLKPNKTETYFDLDHYFEKGFDVIYSGTTRSTTDHDDLNNLIVLAKSPALGNTSEKRVNPPIEIQHLINEQFEPYLKLRVKTNCEIRPGSHVEIDVITPVHVPVNQTGIFSIRKSLAQRGLYTSAISFKNGWIGKPKIIVTNNSHALAELKAGDEIGEISFVNNQSFQ